MNPNQQIPNPADEIEELDSSSLGSVDDFIRQLEEKEKDLHITSDLRIEIEDSDVEIEDVPSFVAEDLNNSQPSVELKTDLHTTLSGGDERVSRMKGRIMELENEIEQLNRSLREVRAERNDIQEKSDRRLKDFENFKYRMDRERRGAFIEQLANMASQMLPVLDNLDRALNNIPGFKDNADTENNDFFNGIVLVNQQLNEILMSMGVEPIAANGQTFDPNFHEAVATDERDDLPANTIIEELLKGYRIGNRVVRHSMVRVSMSAASGNPSNTQDVKLSVSSDISDDLTDNVEVETFEQSAGSATLPDLTPANNETSEKDGELSDLLERFESEPSHDSPESN